MRSAARPAIEHVGPTANAVLFRDRSEVLACLAADWCEGAALSRWWWQSMFRLTDIATALMREWLQSIEFAPRALAHLSERRLAARFAQALGDARSFVLLHRLIERFGLNALAALSTSQGFSSTTQSHAAAKTRDEAGDNSTPSLARSDQPARESPFERWVPEALVPGLMSGQRSLLGIGLMLARAPAVARSSAFADAVLDLRTPSTDVGFRTESIDQPRTSRPPSQLIERREATSPTTTGESHSFATQDATGENVTQQTRPLPFQTEIIPRPEAFSTRAPAIESEHRAGAEPGIGWGSPMHSGPASLVHLSVGSPPVVEPAGALWPVAEERQPTEFEIETSLGGIFYLINVALYLNLYGDFTRPREPGLSLPIWDFLALTGPKLIGTPDDSDAIWKLLAKLSGRDESEPPGAHFQPPDEWRLPVDWLDDFEQGAICTWHRKGDRLVLAHPAGFDIMDLPSTKRDLEPRIKTAAAEYGGRIAVGSAHDSIDTGYLEFDESPLDRWARWIAAFVRARLVRALGIKPEELASILFAHRAVVSVGDARLDVVFSLADLPIEVRLSGLDRDPGWVPAAGRTIAFHFE